MAERIIITLASLLLVFGCEKGNPLPDINPDEQEEKDLTEFTVTLKDVSQVETKLGFSVDEDWVKDLNLFLYSNNGELITNIYREVRSQDDLTFNLKAQDGADCSVFAIANLGYQMDGPNMYRLTESVFGINEYSGMFGENGNCVMSGRKDFNVKKDEVVTVEMRRIMAKVTVLCNYDNLNSNVQLKINSIKICNIPKEVKYFGKSFAKRASDVIDGNCYMKGNLGSITTTGVDFYTFENYQEAELTGATTNKEKAEMLTSLQLKTCSYIQLEYEFTRRDKRER